MPSRLCSARCFAATVAVSAACTPESDTLRVSFPTVHHFAIVDRMELSVFGATNESRCATLTFGALSGLAPERERTTSSGRIAACEAALGFDVRISEGKYDFLVTAYNENGVPLSAGCTHAVLPATAPVEVLLAAVSDAGRERLIEDFECDTIKAFCATECD